jgi:hypothetical protein
MFKSIDELKLTVYIDIAKSRFENALQNITHFINDINSFPWCDGIVFSSAILDNLCQQVGAKILEQHSFNKYSIINNNLVVYIATKLYASGGHTAVIEDFINFQPDKQHLILLTDLLDCAQWKIIKNRFKNLPVTIKRAPAGTMIKKLQWLIKELASANAQKTFLFNHQFDAVAIAAVQPKLVNELFFYHHSDFQLTLGCHLDHAVHIDIHNQALFNCRDKLGVKNTMYWPLAVKDLGVRATENFLLNKSHLTTCSSGSLNKFNIPYAIQYHDLIPEIIKSTEGTHIHIGKVTPFYLKKIKLQLMKQQIDPARFVYIPWVKSVWQTVVERHVDLYICSFPYGGGKTAVEMMGSGTPMIVHDNYAVPLGGGHVVYPEAYQWRYATELVDILKNIRRDDLVKHSHLSRHHYEKYHQDNFIQEQLAKPADLMQGMKPLPLPNFKRDELQSALDIYQAMMQKIKHNKSWRNSKMVMFMKKYYKRSQRLFN